MMNDWYFPQDVHEAAHKNYIKKTGCTPEELREYCLKNIDFFFDVSFAYVERTPPPRMKK
jgi:phosphatidylserine decarboxylase